MTTERWELIGELFAKACALDETERDAFIQTACGADALLEKELRSLLAADKEPYSLLDGVALDAVATLSDLSQEGQLIGPYRLLKQLGVGGMGAVYLAERADGQFEQQVALKVIKLGMDTAQIIKRFQSERQILARLQHPNIARLLDGGVDNAGRPYFVMEYIDGVPLDEYCDSRKLTIDERLRLFQLVCRAVTYAHANLVVHRDLKPSNILVTANGVVKLLDFGIARALAEGEEGTRMTRTGGAVMTPEYASPEQFRGESVTTSTDIYSLGVVLYELLAGQRPSGSVQQQSGSDTVGVHGSEPERPSAVVTKGTLAVPSQVISQSRSTVPDRLRRRLSGDLDVICLSALRAELDRRYQSVEALQADIQRHLSGLPVSAQPDSVVYRFRKFTSRHRSGLAVAVVIAGLISFYTIRLSRESDRVRLESRKAEQVASFLENLFDASDPGVTGGTEPTVRELLDAGADRIQSDLVDQPEVQVDLLSRLASIYYKLGFFDKAIELGEQNLAVASKTYGSDSWELMEVRRRLAGSYRRVRKFTTADSLLSFALTTGDGRRSDSHRRALASSLTEAGRIRVEERDLGVADSLVTLGVEMLRPDDNEVFRATMVTALAEVKTRRRMLAEAESLNVIALEINRRLYTPPHPALVASLTTLAGIHHRRGQFRSAVSTTKEVIDQQIKLFGPDYHGVFTTQLRLSQSLRGGGWFAESAEVARKSADGRTALYGATDGRTRDSRFSLGLSLEGDGHFREAEQIFRELSSHGPGADGPSLRVVNSARGLALLGLARYDEARRLFADVLNERYSNNDLISKGQFEFGLALTASARYEAAEDTLRQASERVLQRYSKDNATFVRTISALAVAIGKQGRFMEADSLFEFAQSEFVRLSDSVNFFRATSLIDRARLRVTMGDYRAAEGFTREALAIREEFFSAKSPLVAEARSELAAVLIELGQVGEARELLDLATPVLEKEFAESHPLRRETLERLEAVRK